MASIARAKAAAPLAGRRSAPLSSAGLINTPEVKALLAAGKDPLNRKRLEAGVKLDQKLRWWKGLTPADAQWSAEWQVGVGARQTEKRIYRQWPNR